MQVHNLSTLERQQGGFTHRFVLTEADLTQTGNATAQTISLLALPVGTLVRNVATRLVTAFQQSGVAANNSTALTVGDTGSGSRYLASQELNVNGTEVYNKAGTGTQLAYDTADTLTATFAAPPAGYSLANLDAGEVHIFVQLADLVQLAGS